MRLAVGRHHGPGRPFGAGGAQQMVVRLLVQRPLLARVQVAKAELPVLGWVVDALLQALALLVKADVQHELHDDGAVLAQHALEVVDLAVALFGGLPVDPAVDHWHQHVLVMAAVVDHELARRRHLLVDAPQVVVAALQRAGRLPAVRAHAQRAGFLEHGADGAVLARGVGALQQHQQLEALVGPEDVLQRVDLAGQFGHAGLVAILVAVAVGLGAGVAILQREALAADGHLPAVQGGLAVVLLRHARVSVRLTFT